MKRIVGVGDEGSRIAIAGDDNEKSIPMMGSGIMNGLLICLVIDELQLSYSFLDLQLSEVKETT